MGITLKLTGAKELERMLLELGGVPAGRIGRNAAAAGARVLAKKARENIRARGLIKTGDLYASIKVVEDRDKPSGSRTAYAGSTLWYAKFSEFGTVKQAATPWARPAIDEGGIEALNAMGENLGKSMEREAHRLARKHGVKK